MLRGIRRVSSNWFGKAILTLVVGFLVMSFAVWGVGDIFRGFGRSTVATVGSTEITIEQFRSIYNERLQQLGSQRGQPITPDQARAFGLDRLILAQLISETALDERAHQLKLGITDAAVADHIRSLQPFQGPDGQFDHRVFEQRIRSAGYTEPRFVTEQRRLMVRQHLTDSISGITATPRTFSDALNQYINERRAIDYVVLGPAQAGEIAQPTPEEIASFFDSRKALFRAPEYRKVTVVRLAQADVAKWMQVSDEDARKSYDEHRSRYVAAGRRQLQQIIFPTPEEAKAAKERIDAGTPFLDIAKERGLSEKDIDLGLVARQGGLPPAVAEAAFALPEGGVSAPVASRVGTALVRVVKIEPERVRPFEEAAAEIKQELARDRTRSEIDDKHNKIEDDRAGGATLAEAAQKAGLQPTTIEAVDRSGRDPAGAAVGDITPDMLTAAFASDVGIETDPVRLPEGGYVWFEVTGVTPSRERPLDEVRPQVEARMRDDRVAEVLKTKAAALLDKLKGGAKIPELASAEGLKVETAKDLQRSVPAAGLSPDLVTAVFRTPQGEAGVAEGQAAGERVVFQVTGSDVPEMAADSPEATRLAETLRGAVSEDLLRQYVAKVEQDLGTTINTDALRRIAGGERE